MSIQHVQSPHHKSHNHARFTLLTADSARALTTYVSPTRTYFTGSTMTVTCEFEASSSSGYVGWNSKGSRLSTNSRISYSTSRSFKFPFSYTYTSTLRVKSLTAADNGIYSCSARSSSTGTIYDTRSWATTVRGRD